MARQERANGLASRIRDHRQLHVLVSNSSGSEEVVTEPSAATELPDHDVVPDVIRSDQDSDANSALTEDQVSDLDEEEELAVQDVGVAEEEEIPVAAENNEELAVHDDVAEQEDTAIATDNATFVANDDQVLFVYPEVLFDGSTPQQAPDISDGDSVSI